MDTRRVIFLFLLMFFILNAPGPQSALNLSEKNLEAQIQEQKRELGVLSNATYSAFDPENDHWLPLPGFTKDAGLAWGLLPVAKRRAKDHLQSVIDIARENEQRWRQQSFAQQQRPLTGSSTVNRTLPVYHNVSGTVRGDWVRWTEAEQADRPRINLTALAMAHDYFTTEMRGNITGKGGTLSFDFADEKAPGLEVEGTYVKGIKSTVKVDGFSRHGGSWTSTMHGIHVPQTGEIFLTTTSDKYAGLTALPYYATSKKVFEASRQLLNKSLTYATSHLSEEGVSFFPWYQLPHPSDYGSSGAPRCEYIIYLQQHPAMIDKRIASPAELQAIEDELDSPIGAPIPPPPLMAMSAVAMSPDCGFVIQSKASPDYPPQDGLYLTGLKREHLKLHVERFLIILSCIFLTQSFFLQRQMKESSTPSTKSRVSFWTIAMMSLGDSLALSFAVLSVLQNANPLLILATGFAGFSGIAFLGMKFQVDLWMTQAPERHEARQQQQQRIQQQLQEQRQRRQQETQRLQQRSPQQPNQQPRQGEGQQEEASPGAEAQANEGLPRPITAPPVPQQEAPTPIFMPFDQDMTQPEEPATETSPGRDAAMMYYRFYFTFFSFFIITSWVLIWPKEIRYIYGYAMTFLYLSCWTPQIYRNIMRNCRKALSWEFVIGESICRLFLPVYILTTRGNIFYIETDGRIAFAMVAWVWAQSWILAGQDLIGPRFFVPKGWAPPAYDYHPLLRDDSSEGSGEDVEAGDTLPLGFLRADEHETSEAAREGNKAAGRNKHVFDCAICMQDIEVPVISKGDAGGRSHVADSATSIFARRQYMVTPCRHIFHSTCLESWMRLRLQCPICRETIPPV